MDGYMGEVKMFGGNYPPKNWMYCEGQELSVNTYASLFSIIGLTYGGDGRVNFALPDLRGRTPIGYGQGPQLHNRTPGEALGAERIRLAAENMPAHSHGVAGVAGTMTCNNDAGTTLEPDGKTLGRGGTNRFNEETPGGLMETANVKVSGTSDSTGSGYSHENMQPWLCTRYIICVSGLYPPRS